MIQYTQTRVSIIQHVSNDQTKIKFTLETLWVVGIKVFNL